MAPGERPRDGAGEVRRPAAASTRLTPEEIASRGFASAFRGVSETEVRNFLRRVADELAASRDRERGLTERVADLDEQLRTPPPLDEQRLLDALGEETTRVLRSAQEAAADIRTHAEERATSQLDEAQETTRRLREDAETHAEERTRTAEAAAAERERLSIEHADATRVAAELSAAETAERATADAAAELERAREAGRAMVEEAREVRERVLADLARRRALMQAQLDELRAGRQRLLEAYRVVKQTLADATSALVAVQTKAHSEGGVEVEPIPDDGIDFSLDAEIPPASTPEPPASGAEAPPTTGPGTERGSVDATDVTDVTDATDATDPGSPASTTAVDALFARLKEERTEPQRRSGPGVPVEATPGPDLEPQPEADASAPEPAPPGEPVQPGEPVPPGEPLPVATPAPSARKQDGRRKRKANPPAGDVAPPTVDLAAGEPSSPPEPAALVARDEAIAKVRSALARRAKRALQDEQNELLDGLRTAKGRPTAESVLPSCDAQAEAWADVLAPGVEEVYRAATRATAPDHTEGGVPRGVLAELGAGLATPRRDRLVSAFEVTGDDTESGDLAQRLGARYREWRTQDLDDALADALVAAWARGTVDAAPAEAQLRWVTPAGGCCPDCDDDALEPTPKGQVFPTGQAAPPAHPGCRCVVVVERSSVASGPRAGLTSADL